MSVLPQLTMGRPALGVDFVSGLKKSMKSIDSIPLVRLGFAYVTLPGAEAFAEGIAHDTAWQQTRKEWIISLHHGISEPAGIRHIAAMPNSKVSLYCGGKVTRRSLFDEPFHAKVIMVGKSSTKTYGLWAGSANLTSSALFGRARNYEAGLWIGGTKDTLPHRISQQLDEWWKTAQTKCIPASDKAIQTYSSLRVELLVNNPALLTAAEPAIPTHLAEASSLWIEAGAMSGGARNQVEFNRQLAEFFGKPQAGTRYLEIKVGERAWNDRPLSAKRTTFGVDIWRLSLPPGAFEYPQTVLHFSKDGSSFLLEVAAANESKALKWMHAASYRGHVGMTSGARRFGFY